MELLLLLLLTYYISKHSHLASIHSLDDLIEAFWTCADEAEPSHILDIIPAYMMMENGDGVMVLQKIMVLIKMETQLMGFHGLKIKYHITVKMIFGYFIGLLNVHQLMYFLKILMLMLLVLMVLLYVNLQT